ncbi:hypothetical protein BpHYR1_032768 [Brachionus plicatilis]|uniref:Uncharacterized protein n=1 Tax=Brachionus plicatilis TaxID=10195 RepID=A0A3M7QH44_BRAPC|nr:hypothetical protein BpHYR1_032768 [Brachionus plicatilis]
MRKKVIFSCSIIWVAFATAWLNCFEIARYLRINNYQNLSVFKIYDDIYTPKSFSDLVVYSRVCLFCPSLWFIVNR